ncbi:glycosyltransferase [Pseudomonas solani]|uniref:glycosyltransferase n=1 Tax=Pseudomonas solani TaxID=2731552 RepID=UPI003D6C00A4
MTFVHSLFRSGSTYFYNALKRTGKVHIYHEPMHEVIASLANSWDQMASRKEELKTILRHNFLEGGYFDEYASLLQDIKRSFDPKFSFDYYFLSSGDEAPDMKTYIDILKEGASQLPVLQCTRTSGRIDWLKENYKSSNVFLLRNPWDQWYSYKVDPYIASTPRIIYAQNNTPDHLKAVLMKSGAPPLYEGNTQEKIAYSLLHPLTPEQDYFLFFGSWLHSFVCGEQYCDVFIDMDELSTSAEYRTQCLVKLEEIGIKSVDFSDAKLHRAIFDSREKAGFRKIEDQVLEIFHQYGVLVDSARKYLETSRHKAFPATKELVQPASDILEDAYRMRELLITREQQIASLSQAMAERNVQIDGLNQAVTERNAQIDELNQAVTECNAQIDELNQAVTERHAQIDELSQTVTKRNAQIDELSQTVTKRNAQIDELNQAMVERDEQSDVLSQTMAERIIQIGSLSKAVVERDTIIRAIRQSKSWKLTAPLRKVSVMFRKNDIGYIEQGSENQATEAGPNAFFTICSKNFLAHARALHKSIRPHYPSSRFFLVLCDKVDGLFDPAKEPFEFMYLEDLELPNLSEMVSRYNITEFNTAVKPFAFLRLMEKFQFTSVVYLDPDLFFVDRMHEVDQLLANGAEAVMTPHILQPAEHDQIHDRSMLQFGIYNLGFLALSNTPQVRSFLQWWSRRLEKDCVIRLEDGLFVDQKWADLLPAFVPGTRILHHPGYNVAYWNLPQRKITRKADQWLANDKPLCFVHFSGNKLDDVTTFSRHSQQVTIDNIGVLRELLDAYRQEVYKQGHAFYRSLPYAYSWDGAAGVNLHTPKELDLATQQTLLVSSAGGAAEVDYTHPGVITVLRRRYSMLCLAFPIARRLSGGWAPLIVRAWSAYQRHGWNYVKTKAVELSGFRAPPIMPPMPRLDQTDTHDDKSRRLLYLDWAIPKPDQDAASVTAALLLQIFDSIGYKVTFVPCGLKYEEGYYEDLIAANIDVIVYPAIQSVKEWLQENAAKYDVCVMARGPVVWPYLETIKAYAPDLRLIFNTVDLHYLRELRQAELTNDEPARQAALVLRDQELELIDKCDLTILLSNDELYTVREHRPEAPLAVLPVVFKDIPGTTKSYDQRRDILFIGSFPHKPNIDAVLYFAESIFPIIKRQIPDIRFKVVGAHPPEEIQKLAATPGIEILGFVKDLEPMFADIRLTIAPLRYGAGIKGKIGTSLCYGVPCVATPMAVEGMRLTAGLNVLVGGSPEEFANAVCDAYQNAERWEILSTEGYRFAQANYSVGVIEKRVRNLLFAVTNGWRAIHNVVELDCWEAFEKHAAKMGNDYQQRVLREQTLLPTDGSDGFRTSGFCCACGTHTRFLTSFMYSTGNTPDGRPMPNWREHMQCEHCGLVNRMRAALNVLHTYAPPETDSQIYITERLTKTYQWLAERYPGIQGSEYFGPSHQPGSLVDGIRHEDVMNLSFAEGSFDRVLSFDVLEHVPDPDRAFGALFSVLRSGGMLIFSVPFSADSSTDIIRATLEEDGTITHHMPPEYHGNPVDPEGGALCFRYFGWQMLDKLRSVGFSNVRCLAYWSEEQGYLGREQYIFVATKQ